MPIPINIPAAKNILKVLQQMGVQEFIVCAGARNAPFVELFAHNEHLKVWTFFEERSAGFFALGRIKVTKKPVVVCTTSGTAVANLLPAVIEAHYTELPLIVLSCDRPKSYRGSGAPQAIEQDVLFGHYPVEAWDLEAEQARTFILDGFVNRRGPWHINVCFDEPLVDFQTEEEKKIERLCLVSGSIEENLSLKPKPLFPNIGKMQSTLVLLSDIEDSDRMLVKKFLLTLQAPIWAEPTSGLREDPELQPYIIKSGELILKKLSLVKELFDSVIRIGGVPVCRFWRDLESTYKDLPVVNFSHREFVGLARGGHFHLEIDQLEDFPIDSQGHYSQADFLKIDQSLFYKINELYEQFPQSECSFIHHISKMLPKQSQVFLANSLPIREWHLCATHSQNNYQYFSNRGANGIDGLVSTSVALCQPSRPTFSFLGDLSTMYDLSGLWPLANAQNRAPCLGDYTLFIINNGGGKIFERIFKPSLFQNPHSQQFAGWAKFWNINFNRIDSLSQLVHLQVGHQIIELCPDGVQSLDFWKNYESLDI